jgi:uncharacterized protein
MKATLSLTHNCNLACKYCYSGKTSKKDMSFATAQKIVDFVMKIALPGRRAEFSFFGGEPLLRFDLIEKIVGYIRAKESETGKPVSLSVTSNGTLLRQPILEFFKKEAIDLCVSIDGPAQVHDRNRVHKDGRGSFLEVVKNLQMAMGCLDAVQVNAVYGPGTIDALPQTVSFFTGLGVPTIHLNPDIRATWSEDTYGRFPKVYTKIADHYIEAYQQGREIAVNFIDSKILLFLKGGYAVQDMCGMGETEWGFAPSGNIYPCERFIGKDDDLTYCLGNIHSGLDLARRCSIVKGRGNRNEECKTCGIKRYCMNWCGCTNHYMTGSTDMVGPALCNMEKAAIRAAEQALIALSKLENEKFIDHLLRYLPGGRHCQEPLGREGKQDD